MSYYRLPGFDRIGTVDLEGRLDSLTEVAFSADSKLLFVMLFDVTDDDPSSQGLLFDVKTMKRLHSYHFEKGPRDSQFDPTGKYIVGMSTDYDFHQISRLSLADGSEQRRQVAKEIEAFAVISPDSVLLSAFRRAPEGNATGQFQLQLMSWNNGEVTHRTPFADSRPVLDLDVSPDGRFVVGAGGHARVWQLPELKEVGVLKAEGEPVRFARFAPDGTIFTETTGIMRGKADGTVLARYDTPGLTTLIVAFPNDGSLLLGVDDSILRFDYATGEELPAIQPPLCVDETRR